MNKTEFNNLEKIKTRNLHTQIKLKDNTVLISLENKKDKPAYINYNEYSLSITLSGENKKDYKLKNIIFISDPFCKNIEKRKTIEIENNEKNINLLKIPPGEKQTFKIKDYNIGREVKSNNIKNIIEFILQYPLEESFIIIETTKIKNKLNNNLNHSNKIDSKKFIKNNIKNINSEKYITRNLIDKL